VINFCVCAAEKGGGTVGVGGVDEAAAARAGAVRVEVVRVGVGVGWLVRPVSWFVGGVGWLNNGEVTWRERSSKGVGETGLGETGLGVGEESCSRLRLRDWMRLSALTVVEGPSWLPLEPLENLPLERLGLRGMKSGQGEGDGDGGWGIWTSIWIGSNTRLLLRGRFGSSFLRFMQT